MTAAREAADQRGHPELVDEERAGQTSFVIAITAPIVTNTTIRI